jgi:hypothetical protein
MVAATAITKLRIGIPLNSTPSDKRLALLLDITKPFEV